MIFTPPSRRPRGGRPGIRSATPPPPRPPTRFAIYVLAALAGLLAAVAVAFAAPPAAHAADALPCGKADTQDFTQEPVQSCPVSDLPAEGVPVYPQPVPNPSGAAPPAPASSIPTSDGRAWFVCDRLFPDAAFYHPKGWRNVWWAYTRTPDGTWGWTPEVYFDGGNDDEPDAGLRTCPSSTPLPGPPPPPPAPDPCEALPAATDLHLRATVGRARHVTARWRRSVTVRGTMTDASGAAVAGAPVCVLAASSARGSERQIATLATDADGRFELKLDATTSRRLRFTHRAGDTAASARVAIDVPTPLTLGASPRTLGGGERVVLSGHLEGAARRAGLLVELQARRGTRYQTFATTRTSRGGHYRYAYRFSASAGPFTYALRARAARQPGLPFATGASKAVKVRVR
jgi:hypothetical protein